MRVTPHDETFDPLQTRVLTEIVTSIRDGLREVGLTDDQALKEATGNIAFSIAAIIDGSRVMELDGQDVIPVLTFAKQRNGDELVAAQSGGSWMHEYVFGAVDEAFESGDTSPDKEDG